MRGVSISLVAVGSVLGSVLPVGAAPQLDLEAYCRAINPEPQAQARCLTLEKASQERLARAQSAIDPQAWSRCQSASASWVEMEACATQSTPPVAAGQPSASGDGGTGSSSTTVPGPQRGVTPTAPEIERPSRPISEAEADRQVQDVLQRAGEPAARCTKKQYGTGWAAVCE
jgi:hypothetical protein